MPARESMRCRLRQFRQISGLREAYRRHWRIYNKRYWPFYQSRVFVAPEIRAGVMSQVLAARRTIFPVAAPLSWGSINEVRTQKDRRRAGVCAGRNGSDRGHRSAGPNLHGDGYRHSASLGRRRAAGADHQQGRNRRSRRANRRGTDPDGVGDFVAERHAAHQRRRQLDVRLFRRVVAWPGQRPHAGADQRPPGRPVFQRQRHGWRRTSTTFRWPASSASKC